MRTFLRFGDNAFIGAILAVMMLALPLASNAITLDFEDGSLLADVGTRHVCSGDAGDWCGDVMTFSDLGSTLIDLDVTADGSGDNWFVWHDLRPSGAGLGASNTEGVGRSDNIFASEEVTLSFSEDVIMDSWEALNHGRGLFGATYSLWVDNVLKLEELSLMEGVTNILGFKGQEFRFLNTSDIDGDSENEDGLIYISMVDFSEVSVPEPSSLVLLGLGLLGLGLRRRGAART